jgi:hypothetical protein
MLADDRDGLGRSHVVARCPVFVARNDVEVLCDDLLTPRESVSPTHAGIITDQPPHIHNGFDTSGRASASASATQWDERPQARGLDCRERAARKLAHFDVGKKVPTTAAPIASALGRWSRSFHDRKREHWTRRTRLAASTKEWATQSIQIKSGQKRNSSPRSPYRASPGLLSAQYETLRTE